MPRPARPARTVAAALLSALALCGTAAPAHAAEHAVIPPGKAPETPCATAPATPVRTGAVFSDPLRDRAGAVNEHLCSLFAQADPGSTIRLALFVVSGAAGEDYVDTLLQAHARGVEVQVVMDGWQATTGPALRLRRALGEDPTASSFVAVCRWASPEGNTSSCQGDKGMHNKFALFSSVAGVKDVVVQSSANVTDVNHRSYWNNAVTVVGNPALHRAYRAYHRDLVAMEQDLDYGWSAHAHGRAGAARVWFFPTAAGDPVAERLAAVRCLPGRTRVAVAQSEWDGTRTAVARELARLHEDGCRVRVVTGPVDTAPAGVLDAAEVPRRLLEDTRQTGRVHSKYLVVLDAARAAEGSRGRGRGLTETFVMTGSHNFNHTSLRRNDEAVLELSHPLVAAQYAADADRLWQVAQPR